MKIAERSLPAASRTAIASSRLLLDGVSLEHPLGEAGATAVEQDQPPEGGKALQEATVGGALPEMLDLRDPAGQEENVEAAVADHLVGDVASPLRA